MSLPFTPDEFFAVFRDYNTAVWPLQVLFNALAVGALALVFAPRRYSGRLISGIPAVLWAWQGEARNRLRFELLLRVYEDIGLLAAGVAGLWLVFSESNQARHA